MKQFARIPWLFALLMQPLIFCGQENYSIDLVKGFEEIGAVWASGYRPDALVVQSSGKKTSLWSDEGLPMPVNERSLLAKRGLTWQHFPNAAMTFHLRGMEQSPIGTCQMLNDSTALVAIATEWEGVPKGSIVQVSVSGQELHSPVALAIPPVGGTYLHPNRAADGEQIVFAAFLAEKPGDSDLYFINKVGEAWSAPVSLGEKVNTAGMELFPAWAADGNLYFSSDRAGGLGGLDFYSTTRQSQWKQVEHLPSPANSEGDDFLYLELEAGDALISSSRSGQDQVYRLRQQNDAELAVGLSALLVSAGTPLQGANIRLFNTLGEQLWEHETDERGRFDIGFLEMKRSYRAVFENIPDELLMHSLLYIIDGEGKRIMVFSPQMDGSFLFELMNMSEHEELSMMDNPDESRLLSVVLEGQVYREEPGDLEGGDLIYVVDPEGSLLAVGYTGEGGQFRFSELRPDAAYQFRLDPDSQAGNIRVTDGNEEAILTVSNGKARYQRVQDEDAVVLVNERGERVVIRNEELFVLSSIYYDFNDDRLKERGKQQLKKLHEVLKQNPSIKVELHSHTDARGTHDFNQELSDRRAVNAKSFLLALGLQKERLRAIGFGESQLLNDCDDENDCDEEAHAVNRRTEIRLIR